MAHLGEKQPVAEGHREEASWPQYPSHLPCDSQGLGQVVNGQRAEDAVEARVRVGQRGALVQISHRPPVK